MGNNCKKVISIFIDESGDFGEYSPHSPYYIITMVMHDQDVDIDYNLKCLEHELLLLGLHKHCIHTGPIIRQEDEYRNFDIQMRRRIFNKMVAVEKHCLSKSEILFFGSERNLIKNYLKPISRKCL